MSELTSKDAGVQKLFYNNKEVAVINRLLLCQQTWSKILEYNFQFLVKWHELASSDY